MYMYIAMAFDHVHTALFFLECPTGGWKEGSEMLNNVLCKGLKWLRKLCMTSITVKLAV